MMRFFLVCIIHIGTNLWIKNLLKTTNCTEFAYYTFNMTLCNYSSIIILNVGLFLFLII